MDFITISGFPLDQPTPRFELPQIRYELATLSTVTVAALATGSSGICGSGYG